MGCFFELIFELLISVVAEIISLIYLKITSLFVTEAVSSEKTKKKISDVVTTISVLELVVLLIGMFLLLPPDSELKLIGKYMTLVPLVMIGFQILLGSIVKVAKFIKKR